MPKPSANKPIKSTPDVTSVRSLVTGVTALARHVDLTPNAIYRWIAVNRIPGRYILKIAQYYDIDIPMHLAQSDEKNTNEIIRKPRDTLPTCLRVQAGEMSIEEAAAQLGLNPKSVTLILANWGEQLPLLYQTLVAVEKGELSLDQAALTLQVSKYNIHALRKKYGFQPKPRPKAAPKPIHERRRTTRAIALEAIAGHITLAAIQDKYEVSWRTVHRAIAKLSPEYSLIELAHWPKALREAYAQEIEKNLTKLSEKLWIYAKNAQISLRKTQKYPKRPANWRAATAKTMMVHILLGLESLESVATSRGADPSILAGIFTSDLRPLDLTWPQVMEAPVLFQIALGELMMDLENARKTPRLRMIEKFAEEKAHD